MKVIEKDITVLEAPAIILHGVNCQGVMGSGVAKAIYTKWPDVKNQYLIFPYKILGNTNLVCISEQIYVINCFTQKNYGYDGKIYADLNAIEKCLYKSVVIASRLNKENQIYLPKIGCQLGGLNWNTDLKPLLEKIENNLDIEFTICI